MEAGRKLAVPAENRWGMRTHSSVYTSWPFMYANGVDVVNDAPPYKAQFDNPKVAEAFQYSVDLIHKHRVAPVLEGKNKVEGGGLPAGQPAAAPPARRARAAAGAAAGAAGAR